MSSNFVSIIIPAFNAQKTIEKCLKSILEMNFNREWYEIIVVDNNSIDDTATIIEKFPRVTYVKETRQGRSYARNTGASRAKGNLLAFVDSDVCLEKDWLKYLVLAFNKKTVGGAQGRIIPSNSDGQQSLNEFRIRQQNESTFGTNIILNLKYSESPMINSAACVYSAEAFSFVGGFDILLERHEDIDLSKRVCLAGFDLVLAECSLAYVEYHGEGWFSYFKRSFQEGSTKQCYNKKWQQYNDLIAKKSKNKFKTNFFTIFKHDQIKGFKINIRLIIDEVFVNFARGIYFGDSYFLKKSLNSLFKSTGRIHGILCKDYPGQFVERYHSEVLDRVIFLNQTLEIEVDKDLRFVMQNEKILYILNLKKNEIVTLENFNCLELILNHRVLRSETAQFAQ